MNKQEIEQQMESLFLNKDCHHSYMIEEQEEKINVNFYYDQELIATETINKGE